MMTRTNSLAPRRTRLVACVALTLALVSCSKPATTEGPRLELSPEAQSSIDRALAAYDDVRSKLASDQVAAVSDDAQRLGQAAADASKSAPPSLHATLESLSTAAAGLQSANPDDPDAVRGAFGEVSRAAIALVAADSRLSDGRYVYECFMAEGYGKWLQTSDKVANPYMGSRMLECGSEVAWDANP